MKQVHEAISSPELQAQLLSLLPPSEMAKYDRATGEAIVDVPMLSGLVIWLMRSLLTNVQGALPAPAPQLEDSREQQESGRSTPAKRKTNKRKKADQDADEVEDDDFEIKKADVKDVKKKKSPTKTPVQQVKVDVTNFLPWTPDFWQSRLCEILQTRTCVVREAIMLWVALARALGIDARFVLSIAPMPRKDEGILTIA